MICHEAAHFVVWRRHGQAARPHGPEWAALVKLAGFEPKAARVRCGLRKATPVTAYVFRHICPVCHFSRRAARRMTRWRCPECRALGLDGVSQNRTGFSIGCRCPIRLVPSAAQTRVECSSNRVLCSASGTHLPSPTGTRWSSPVATSRAGSTRRLTSARR